MSHERNGDLAQHRLFHAMVLMGGSIALGCGGMSAGTGDDEGGTGGTGALSGAGTAGTTTIGSGGTTSGSGGTSASGAGGAISLPPVDAGPVPEPLDCPPAQWTCSDIQHSCFGDTYALPTDCACDTTRPIAPSDCPAGTVYACHAGARAPDGTPLPQLVSFSCSCVPDSRNCDAECLEAAPTSGTCTDVQTPSGRSVLCNCAVIVLR